MKKNTSEWLMCYFKSKYEKFSFLDKAISLGAGVFFLGYLLLRGTPSSFSYAYRLLGIESKNIFGVAQSIRSDEWGIYTPKLISAWNSSWNISSNFSPLSVEFGPVFPVPRRSFSMILDVFQWPFFIFPAPLALSFYWVSLFVLCFFGWRLLLAKLGIPIWLAWIGSFLLIFNAYQQAWLTVLGINLLLMPLMSLVIINVYKNIWGYLIPFLVGAISLSATSYIPGVVAMLYGIFCLGLIQVVSSKLEIKNLLFNLIALGMGMLAVIALRYDEFRMLSETVYPGQRMGTGGGVPFSLWLSQFFPTLVYSGWQDLINLNTCEAAAVGTLLPLFILSYVIFSKTTYFVFTNKIDFTKIFASYKSEFILMSFFLLFTYWQLIGFPYWLSNISLLGHMRASRTLIVSGPVLIILSLKLISRMKLERLRTIVSLGISSLFALIVGVIFSRDKVLFDYIGEYDLTGLKRIFILFLTKDDSIAFICFGIALLVSVSALTLNLIFELNQGKIFDHLSRFILVCTIVLPNVYIWGTFNPIYSADRIFAITKSQAAIHSQEYFSNTSQSVILPNIGPIGILPAIFIRTPQMVSEVPPIDFWQKLIGEKYETYSQILNRYAYITVADVEEPSVISPDVIQVPQKWFWNNPDYVVPRFMFHKDELSLNRLTSSHRITCNEGDEVTEVDSVVQMKELDDWKITLSGWLRSSEIRNFYIEAKQTGNPNLRIHSVVRQTRFDVLTAVNFPSAVSGYVVKLEGVRPDKCVDVNFYSD